MRNMMRNTLFLVPLIAATALVVAEDPATPAQPLNAAQLVDRLGHKDFAVREQATAALVKLGEKAVPALEKALESDDLEVRLRAGRALRRIRGVNQGPKKSGTKRKDGSKNDVDDAPAAGIPNPNRPRPAPGSSSTSVEMRDGRVRVTVTEIVDGKRQTKTYEGASIEELRNKHPELRGRLGGIRFRLGRDPFDMDKFWKDFRKRDDPFRKWHEETQRQMEEMRRMWEQLRRSRPGFRPGLNGRLDDRRARATGRLLGVRAKRPEPVLDAQLQLRGRGLVIDTVEPDSRAARLGLKRHDILVELNGTEIRRFEDVARALARKVATTTAKVVRAANLIELNAGK